MIKLNLRTHLFSHFLLVGTIGLLLVSSAWAQSSQESTEEEELTYNLTGSTRFTTLSGWMHRLRSTLLDRSGNLSGMISDRGYIQRYVKGMNDEYMLNMAHFYDLPSDDYLWYRAPNGFRGFIADLDGINGATFSEFQSQVSFYGRNYLYIHGQVRNDFTRQTAFMNIGYYRSFNRFGTVGLEHTFGSDKIDLDVGLFYQLGNQQIGHVRLDITALDYLNNLSSNNQITPQGKPDSTRFYNVIPVLFQFHANTPSNRRLHLEMVGGIQLQSEAEIAARNEDDYEFIHKESAMYAGGIIEYATDYVTFGTSYRLQMSSVTRDTVDGSIVEPSYTVDQFLEEKAVYILGNAKSVYWDSWLWMNDYSDLRDGTAIDETAEIPDRYDFNEEQIIIRNRIMWRPEFRGVILGVEHIAEIRSNSASIPNADEDGFLTPEGFNPIRDRFPNAFHSNNNRISFSAGYQFHPRATILGALSLDLDNDFHRSRRGQSFDTFKIELNLRW